MAITKKKAVKKVTKKKAVKKVTKKKAVKKVAKKKAVKKTVKKAAKKITASAANRKDAKVRDKAVQRALTDPKFRKQLLKSPRKVLGGLRGKKLDNRVKVVVHEDTDRIRHIVLPFTGVEVEEISDKELQTLVIRNTALQVCWPIG